MLLVWLGRLFFHKIGSDVTLKRCFTDLQGLVDYCDMQTGERELHLVCVVQHVLALSLAAYVGLIVCMRVYVRVCVCAVCVCCVGFYMGLYVDAEFQVLVPPLRAFVHCVGSAGLIMCSHFLICGSFPMLS